tara:strand:+ start:434 stop:673 length:240 start_codon:yes stop_codon:yes gene_type:complete
LKIFWPHRSDAKGFSIENLELKYRKKNSSSSSVKTSNQLLSNQKLKTIEESRKQIDSSNHSNKKGHWANRDFSEYKKAA